MFKLHHVHNGYSRVCYTTRDHVNALLYYCLQDEGRCLNNVVFYRTCKQWEPMYPIKRVPKQLFELPPIETHTGKVIYNFLKEQNNDLGSRGLLER